MAERQPKADQNEVKQGGLRTLKKLGTEALLIPITAFSLAGCSNVEAKGPEATPTTPAATAPATPGASETPSSTATAETSSSSESSLVHEADITASDYYKSRTVAQRETINSLTEKTPEELVFINDKDRALYSNALYHGYKDSVLNIIKADLEKTAPSLSGSNLTEAVNNRYVRTVNVTKQTMEADRINHDSSNDSVDPVELAQYKNALAGELAASGNQSLLTVAKQLAVCSYQLTYKLDGNTPVSSPLADKLIEDLETISQTHENTFGSPGTQSYPDRWGWTSKSQYIENFPDDSSEVVETGKQYQMLYVDWDNPKSDGWLLLNRTSWGQGGYLMPEAYGNDEPVLKKK